LQLHSTFGFSLFVSHLFLDCCFGLAKVLSLFLVDLSVIL